MTHPTTTWPLDATITVDPVGPDEPTAVVEAKFTVQSMFGRGVMRPFRRDKKGDFANGDGPELVKAAVMQILGTKATSQFAAGEVPWRGGFGSLLHLLLHAQNNPALFELANHYVVQALSRWEPRIRVTQVSIESSATEENKVFIDCVYDFIDINTGNVVFQDLETRIQIP